MLWLRVPNNNEAYEERSLLTCQSTSTIYSYMQHNVLVKVKQPSFQGWLKLASVSQCFTCIACLISILPSLPINANPAIIIISLNLVFNPPDLAPSSSAQSFHSRFVYCPTPFTLTRSERMASFYTAWLWTLILTNLCKLMKKEVF